MVFNSVEFLIFFCVVTTLYFVVPKRLQWPMLLGASCFFYMFFKPIYILILFFTITVDYFAGILLENAKDIKWKKLILLASVVANVGVLATFKYYNFIIENVEHFLHFSSFSTLNLPYLNILLPIGLSFHTFQAMSYTIEIYRGHVKAERNYGIYALYVMFYPQLVAGPIERPQNILPQLHLYHRFNYLNFNNGMKLILWGLFKKVVIADHLSEFVNLVYKNPSLYNGFAVIIGCVFFSFQIYCDFSGYSDIAIGTARVMGVTLMNNFERPYLSQSIGEFWGRWHISLSTWFRDYVYIPMGGNRVPKLRMYANQMTVFILSGLWHGASWTFVVWGLLHGTFIIVESVFKSYFPNNNSQRPTAVVFKRILVFGIVCFAWIFFRAANFSNAHDIIYTALHVRPGNFSVSPFGETRNYELVLSFILILALLTFEICQGKDSFLQMINKWSKPSRWSFLLVLIVALLMFGAFHNSSEFIYFQF